MLSLLEEGRGSHDGHHPALQRHQQHQRAVEDEPPVLRRAVLLLERSEADDELEEEEGAERVLHHLELNVCLCDDRGVVVVRIPSNPKSVDEDHAVGEVLEPKAPRDVLRYASLLVEVRHVVGILAADGLPDLLLHRMDVRKDRLRSGHPVRGRSGPTLRHPPWLHPLRHLALQVPVLSRVALGRVGRSAQVVRIVPLVGGVHLLLLHQGGFQNCSAGAQRLQRRQDAAEARTPRYTLASTLGLRLQQRQPRADATAAAVDG